MIVGTIIVCSCSLATLNIKNEAENQQLTNINKYVATESLNILSSTEADQNTTQFLNLPSQVGNQIFWIRIENDSFGAWVESGLGTTVGESQSRIYIPADILASGTFVSSFGRAFLLCNSDNQTVTLTLASD